MVHPGRQAVFPGASFKSSHVFLLPHLLPCSEALWVSQARSALADGPAVEWEGTTAPGGLEGGSQPWEASP